MIVGTPGLLVARSFPPVLSDVYTGKGTQALGLADTGHAWWNYAAVEAARLTIIDSKLTNTASDAVARAGYIHTSVGEQVTRIGGRFTLSPTTNPGGGVAVFVTWRWPLVTSASVPDTNLHLIVSSVSWSASWWENGTPTNYAGGGDTFSVPLATDGATVHEVDVTISGTTAHIVFPDASTADITDAHIASLAGTIAGFEIYQGDASTDEKAAFTEVWAEA